MNQLAATSAATYTYDANGNTTSKTDSGGESTYTWDYENRLVSVALPGQGGTISFAYDPFGRRIKKVSPAGTTIYAYDGDNVIEELDAGGNIEGWSTQGLGVDEPLAMYRGATASYYHADGLGSVTSLTDGTGTVAASCVYDSFGNLTASTGSVTNPFRYTARESDSETGLYYYRARYYDPASGRFLSEDPTTFLSGGLNFYDYVDNSPVNFADPTGLQKQPCCDRNKISSGLGQAKAALRSVAAAQNPIFVKYKDCLLRNITRLEADGVTCEPSHIERDPRAGTVTTRCGSHHPYDPDSVRLTPEGAKGTMGCPGAAATIVHETVHVCYQNDVMGEMLTGLGEEKQAFGLQCALFGTGCECARNPKKCGY